MPDGNAEVWLVKLRTLLRPCNRLDIVDEHWGNILRQDYNDTSWFWCRKDVFIQNHSTAYINYWQYSLVHRFLLGRKRSTKKDCFVQLCQDVCQCYIWVTFWSDIKLIYRDSHLKNTFLSKSLNGLTSLTVKFGSSVPFREEVLTKKEYFLFTCVKILTFKNLFYDLSYTL